MNIKKDDKVIVLSGKDKGKEGKVLVADPKGLKTPIYACKVQLVCPKCGKATRVAHKITDGKKTRVCKKCGAEI